MVSGIQAMNSSAGDDFMPGTIILPPNLQSIPRWCFGNCMSLTHIRIPPSVQQIGERALSGSDLRSIEIPETVHRIGREACSDCAALERVTFHSSTNLIMDNDIFTNCPLLSVIQIAPWLWPKLFASMNGQPDFIFRFYRQYHTQIFDFNDWWVNRNVNHDDSRKQKTNRIQFVIALPSRRHTIRHYTHYTIHTCGHVRTIRTLIVYLPDAVTVFHCLAMFLHVRDTGPPKTYKNGVCHFQ